MKLPVGGHERVCQVRSGEVTDLGQPALRPREDAEHAEHGEHPH